LHDRRPAVNPRADGSPYWDDLVVAAINGVCQKTVSGKPVIQWSGQRFGVASDFVPFQMSLGARLN
jgi:hypothetical protein